MAPVKPTLSGKMLREIFETVLTEDRLRGVVERSGLQERQRKLDAVALFRAMIVAAGTGYGGRQRDIARVYFENGARPVARAGFYGWFGPHLEAAMKEIATAAMAYARSLPLDVPPLLASCARDFHIVDSSTVKLPNDLAAIFPGTGDYAALKIHKRLSVGTGVVFSYHLSPAREHDSLHLDIDESWRGLGVLMDLGYASIDRLRKCDAHDVRYVIRLKENWKPKVESIQRGEVSETFLAGSDLDALLEDGTLLLGGRVIDATVTLGPQPRSLRARLVGVPGPDREYHFYLTNLAGQVGPRQVADIYRVRWEIESDNKLDKSCHHLDEIGAKTEASVRALVHASLIGSMLASLIAHRHRLAQPRPRGRAAERVYPPLHTQTLARAMAGTATRIAATLAMEPALAEPEWQKIADYLLLLGYDPNWRRRPSVLDQMRGWKVLPATRGRRKAAK